MNEAKPSSTIPNALLRQQRETRNWTQEALAEKLGTSAQSVSRWERGASSPSLYYRERLCALFSTSAEALGLLLDADREQGVGSRDERSTHTYLNAPPASDWPLNDPAIPLLKHEALVGRDSLLADLKVTLLDRKSVV
jgi:transcriptional regulator with XRE-family HTH domain